MPGKILLVEDNETHAHVVCRHLRKISRSRNSQPNAAYHIGAVETATSLAEAIAKLSTQPESNESDPAQAYSTVLLDLSLPDSPIHKTLGEIVSRFPNISVVVLTSLNDLDFAAQAVQQGAQDYLVKTDLNSDVLERAIRYAIERKRAQVELQEYAAKLEESNRHLESFAHTLAHEIRSPLTVVSGCLQMINASHYEKFDSDTRETLSNSLQAITGMTDLVEELLEFSQANARGADEFELVELESVFYYAYTVLRPEIKTANATLTHDSLPSVNGNEPQLRQLLQNLITNAIKYRGQREPEIHIGCEETTTRWTFSVTDNGVGIEDSDQSKVFRAFTRLESSKKVPGVGIGLAFCQRIVENHGGEIWVESKLGTGSTFFFSLPK